VATFLKKVFIICSFISLQAPALLFEQHYRPKRSSSFSRSIMTTRRTGGLLLPYKGWYLLVPQDTSKDFITAFHFRSAA
jgi:hypothetical protein